MSDFPERLSNALHGSRLLRLAAIGFLALILQIPIAMIASLVAERSARHSGAIAEVSEKWGGAQQVMGPALTIPYTVGVTELRPDGSEIVRVEQRRAVFLPANLDVDGDLTTEKRSRGIYSVPVYTLRATLAGEFAQPDFAELGVEPIEVLWDRASLVVGVSDARAIQSETQLNWDGRQADLIPGSAGVPEIKKGVAASVQVNRAQDRITFSMTMVVRGTTSLEFAPAGEQTTVNLRADFPHPSFMGGWLPLSYTVDDESFSADWSIPFLGRGYPQGWIVDNASLRPLGASLFGVALVNPVNEYTMAERSVKYAGLFVLLTFALVWLVELRANVRVHPIQYMMLGAALCLFFLLELSLSEHFGFAAAYLVAATAVVLMCGAFSQVALGNRARATVVGASVAGLYAFLYVVLRSEDYALLIGSVGLFFTLAGVMYATSRINWYSRANRVRDVAATDPR